MFGWFNGQKNKNSRMADGDNALSARMIFALRERLEDEGLGNSLQAENLDRAMLQNRDYVLMEMKPLFSQLDRNHIDRTTNPRFWWWRIDDERIVAEVSERVVRE